MNIDLNIVARALNKGGEEPLNKEEIENKKGTRWRLISDLYLATILEELSSVNWTSQKVRERLEEEVEEENLTSYRWAYKLPIDCAKPVGLNSGKEYLIEGSTLYTEDEDAVLIYITNYFTGRYKYIQADPQPESQEELEEKEYFIFDDEEQEYIKVTSETEYSELETYFLILEEDYPFYNQPKFDPMLEEALACKLASKIILKLSGDPGKYQLLYQEAAIIENRATKTSVAHGHNKSKGNLSWAEQLGLPGED